MSVVEQPKHHIKLPDGSIEKQTTTLNFGPTHPATHGVFQNILELDGERIVDAEQTVGYIHRAFEKIAERRPLYQITPLTDRLNYCSSPINNMGWHITCEKLLGIKINARIIDTLGLSWTLYPNRFEHGLGEWGEDLGIAKPPIVDWKNEPVEVYVHRCSEDVKINTKLFNLQLEYLKKIYDNDLGAIGRYMDYISFKLDCAKEQEEVRVKIDVQIPTEFTTWSPEDESNGKMDRIKLKFYRINNELNIVHEQSEKIYNDIVQTIKTKCNTQDWDFRAKKYVEDKMFMNFKYNHAITVHKSQGSTYKQVCYKYR